MFSYYNVAGFRMRPLGILESVDWKTWRARGRDAAYKCLGWPPSRLRDSQSIRTLSAHRTITDGPLNL